MCGRFVIDSAYPKLTHKLGVTAIEENLPTRYSILPGTWITGFRQVSHKAPPEQLKL